MGLGGGVNFWSKKADDQRREHALTTEDSEVGGEELRRAFDTHWLRRFSQVLPVPAALLGLWIIATSGRWLTTGVAVAAYVAFNLTMTEISLRRPRFDRSATIRGLGNAITLFLVGFVAEPQAEVWLLGVPPAFAGTFLYGRFRLWLAALLGLVGGTTLAGRPPVDVLRDVVVLTIIAYLVSRIYEPLKAASIGENLQRQRVTLQNEKLESALQARQTFLANMSHEIRTPLNGVLGMAEILEQTELDDEQRAMLDVVNEAGRGLLCTINDILDMAKLEAGHLAIEESSFNPGVIVQRTIDLLKAGPHAATLQIDVSCTGLPQAVRSDPMRLRQVVLNLVGNAIKFTPAGSVQTSLSWADHKLTVQVQDSGIGIPEDRLDGLFSPFEQVDASTARKYGGTGLGLTICKSLVALLGGELWVKSQEGKGSTFGFTIPAPMGQITVSESADSLDLTQARILVVDDNLINLRVAQSILTQMGCEVTKVSSGPEAIAAVAQQQFDAVLMDCQMPEMDGVQATIILRQNGLTIPILALTAGITPVEQRRCREAGMNDVIAKPVSSRDLRAAFRKWMPAVRGA